MRDRGILLVLLGSSLAALASLYMPWLRGPSAYVGVRLDGWSGGSGDLAALVALTLGFATLAALLCPQLVTRLPLGALSLGLAYFVAGIALSLRAERGAFGSSTAAGGHFALRWSYGVWVGIAAGSIAALAGLVLRRHELLRRRDPADVLADGLRLALLLSFLLPWLRSHPGNFPGLSEAAPIFAAVVLLFAMGRRRRLTVTVAVAVLVGAAALVPSPDLSLRFGVWIGIGCVAALAVVEAIRVWPRQRPPIVHGWPALRAAAALALVVALFLPWQEVGLTNHIFALSGWQEFPGAATGALALVILAAPALPWLLETIAAIVFLVAWLGADVVSYGPVSSFRIAYGAYIGFAATGLLLLTVLAELRPVPVDRNRALARALPVGASLCCLAAVVVPTWNVLPGRWLFQTQAVSGLFVVVGILLALYLVHAWTSGGHLRLAALALLALPVLSLIRFRNELDQTLAAWILTGLCLFLLLLGWIEERGGGLESFRVPEEIWRIDRLTGES